MSWLANNINGILVGMFTVVQLLALVIVWFYLAESTKTDAEVLYDYLGNSKTLFLTSFIALFVLWFFIPENKGIVAIMIISAALWFITAIGFFVLSIITKGSEVKSNMRSAMVKAIVHMVIAAVAAWIIYI